MKGPRLLIRTPSRLHFGLLGWGPGADRQFGGLGLMIQQPAIVLIAEASPSAMAEGPLAVRARRILGMLADRLAERGFPYQPLSIRVLQAPPEHVGLGVGTQLTLAIAAAHFRLAGLPLPSCDELARLTGRGIRSGIGLHGFLEGGFLVDAGRKASGDVPALIARQDFPEGWSILVVQPPESHGLHGADEVRAFTELPPICETKTDHLCRIVLLGILPAIVERDLTRFGEALEELQEQVGESFASVQGGRFSSPQAPGMIDALHRAGFVGCGQSSWGPALYAFSDRPRDEVEARAEAVRLRLGLKPAEFFITAVSNRGVEMRETVTHSSEEAG